MANHKTKLELTWIGKDNRPRLEPRILIEDPAKSYHASSRVSDKDTFDNRLIFGDNLLALKALEQEFAGKIKCIYIDPPYNTGSAFTHYDDGIEHSLWLSLMRDRLEILRQLLAEDGSIWVSLDDNEGHYAKVLMDEIFGRANFLSTVIWEKKYAPKADSKYLSRSHDFVIAFAKNLEKFTLNRLEKTEKQTGRYTNRDNDVRGPWKPGDTLRNEVRDYAVFPVQTPSGREVYPSAGTSWRYTKEKFAEMIADNRIWFGVDGNARPAVKRFLSEVTGTIPATTIWKYDEVGHNDESKKESKELFGDQLFGTPKPERLMVRVIALATNPGDWILDSFAGSGTTGAVAHKMGRRWIMVELGEHCHTHIIPRLKKVIDGEDKGGITEAAGWTGGGGFRYYRLAPSLLEKDQFGNWVINRKYNGAMLTEAICKLEGFTYAPSDTVYWQHGRSTEKDFIYVTTQTLTRDQIQKLSDEVGEEQSLLVLCGAFRVKNLDAFPNLTIKKIPKTVLSRCEWGKDDYSLEIKSLPMSPQISQMDADDETGSTQGREKARTKEERRAQAQPSLFDSLENNK
ncbi:MAG: site-specific DNA-methyltransferase [bacterium]|uniref:Site-specific DNA-methyltransferase n=1 Tax=Candidatus Methylomirabilis tolerans TaxID=3123416 RepID=A0AAJ1AGR9_9BACT|nr:site-specific DNA-methyltransferase [Candidatus Methylomirabilis sp.]